MSYSNGGPPSCLPTPLWSEAAARNQTTGDQTVEGSAHLVCLGSLKVHKSLLEHTKSFLSWGSELRLTKRHLLTPLELATLSLINTKSRVAETMMHNGGVSAEVPGPQKAQIWLLSPGCSSLASTFRCVATSELSTAPETHRKPRGQGQTEPVFIFTARGPCGFSEVCFSLFHYLACAFKKKF